MCTFTEVWTMSILNWIGNCHELSTYSRYDNMERRHIALLDTWMTPLAGYGPILPTKGLRIGETKKTSQREVFSVEVYSGTPVHHAPRCRYGRGQRIAHGFDQRRRSRNWYDMSGSAGHLRTVEPACSPSTDIGPSAVFISPCTSCATLGLPF